MWREQGSIVTLRIDIWGGISSCDKQGNIEWQKHVDLKILYSTLYAKVLQTT